MPRPSSTSRFGALPPTRHLVLAAATLMIGLQLGVRAWALFPSWFYTDDYRFLSQASSSSFDWAYLSLPMDNHFMPIGRALAYLVADGGHVNWGLAATLTWTLQLVADVACLVMLASTFGVRWRILVPLSAYLYLPVTVPAMMWWAASLNQLPLQIVFFASVTTWIRYARTARWRWLLATLGILGIGLFAYEKAVLVFGVLAFLLVSYFASGGPAERLRHVVRRYWRALLSAVALGAGFVGYYSANVEAATDVASLGLFGRLADTMLGTAFGSSLIGGPWRWDASNPPVARAAPPDWAVHLSWTLVTLLVLWLLLTRTRTLRAWALLAAYLLAAYLLVATSRVEAFGPELGLEYRYLTDVVPVLALCLGLATMPVLGAVESSGHRTQPLLTVAAPRWLPAALVVAVVVSSMVSTVRYVRIWHDDNPGDKWTHSVIEGLRGQGPVDLADQVVPEKVIPFFLEPYNSTAVVVPLLADNVSFPDNSDRLVVLDEEGNPRLAEIDAVATSRPGPVAGCGWQIGDGGSDTIPLDAATFDYVWWVKIGYLASADDVVTLRMGDSVVNAPVRKGLHSLFVKVSTSLSSVGVGGMNDATTLCVDKVEVGNAEAGGYL